MSEKIKGDFREKIGKNLKNLIEEREKENTLRKLDASIGKDHSWLGKVFKGQQNFTIDSLADILIQFKIQPKELFDFVLEFDSKKKKS
ncbi:hypothetical protein ESA94_15785 [Lacibacter luteus]|uniref:XRE family transcriptional regulator n=1 Tax=Lacibacter luteus TaxID=2508719 RepID=A0A4V1M794_9BACT|nr:hypothetical protein [Lacibacter luteus]RXK58848.1 hypothetical protein ESA94_15785 [Lacibacter luteus]